MARNFHAMHHTFSCCAMSAQGTASVCAILLLGSAIVAESIFVAIISIIILGIILALPKTHTA